MSDATRQANEWRTGLPPFNRLVVAYLVGGKEHSGLNWKRDGFAFMVRHDSKTHVIKDGWAVDRYDIALKQIDADYLEVSSWLPLERPL